MTFSRVTNVYNMERRLGTAGFLSALSPHLKSEVPGLFKAPFYLFTLFILILIIFKLYKNIIKTLITLICMYTLLV